MARCHEKCSADLRAGAVHHGCGPFWDCLLEAFAVTDPFAGGRMLSGL